MFEPVPDGFTIDRQFENVRITRSLDGSCVGVQFAKEELHRNIRIVLEEESFWFRGCRQWYREDYKNPRWNLAGTLRIIRELRELGLVK